ncbi:MAG: GC-type dockerin domain-anchored protein [Planctomycetota bacterium]
MMKRPTCLVVCAGLATAGSAAAGAPATLLVPELFPTVEAASVAADANDLISINLQSQQGQDVTRFGFSLLGEPVRLEFRSNGQVATGLQLDDTSHIRIPGGTEIAFPLGDSSSALVLGDVEVTGAGDARLLAREVQCEHVTLRAGAGLIVEDGAEDGSGSSRISSALIEAGARLDAPAVESFTAFDGSEVTLDSLYSQSFGSNSSGFTLLGARLTTGWTELDGGATFTMLDGSTGLLGSVAVRGQASFVAQGSVLVLNEIRFSDADFAVQGNASAVIERVEYFGRLIRVESSESELSGSGNWFTDVENSGRVTILGDTAVAGDYRNDGTTAVQFGTLTITGSLQNEGTILGDVVGPLRGAEQSLGLIVGGDLSGGTIRVRDAAPTVRVAGAIEGLDAIVFEVPGGSLDAGLGVSESQLIDLPSAVLRIGSAASAHQRAVLPGLTEDRGPSRLALASLDALERLELVNRVEAQPDSSEDAIYTRELVIEPGSDVEISNDIIIYARAASGLEQVTTGVGQIVVLTDCIADVTTDGANQGEAGYGIPNGEITVTDLTFFVEQWLAGNASRTDLTTDGANAGDPGYGEPDGLVAITDLTYYVENWLAGCP